MSALLAIHPRRTAATAALLALVAAPLAGAQLTIRLKRVPPTTPAGATIHLAGSFNSWNPNAADYALTPQGGGVYGITLPDSVRGAIEFKFTLGSWASVETTASGSEVRNRTFLMPASGAARFDGVVEGWRTNATAPRRSTASASVSVLSDRFPLPQLGRTRRVWLYLPPDYGSSKKRYPVLYMHDGQNVFDSATGFAGEWGVDESLDRLHAAGDWGAIVVAVDNGGDHRMDEYDPWANENKKLGGGEGDAYVDFLVRTLKPYVDQHYRTRPGRLDTGIMGSSMGGLISLYAALQHPEVFGLAGVFSCACWVANPHIYAYARKAIPRRPLPRFYFVSGARETNDGEPARDQRRMVDTLVAAGFPARTSVWSRTLADGKHAEWFWRREFPAAYRWLFSQSAPRATSTSAHRKR
jgi:metallo-beta-lactamase class B